MRCVECSTELLSGFSECFACGCQVPFVMRRANSPYHESLSRSGRAISSQKKNNNERSIYDSAYTTRTHQEGPGRSGGAATGGTPLRSPSSTSATKSQTSLSSVYGKRRAAELAAESDFAVSMYDKHYKEQLDNRISSENSRSVRNEVNLNFSTSVSPYRKLKEERERERGSYEYDTNKSSSNNKKPFQHSTTQFLSREYRGTKTTATAAEDSSSSSPTNKQKERQYHLKEEEAVAAAVSEKEQKNTNNPYWSKFSSSDRGSKNTGGIWNPEEEIYPWRNSSSSSGSPSTIQNNSSALLNKATPLSPETEKLIQESPSARPHYSSGLAQLSMKQLEKEEIWNRTTTTTPTNSNTGGSSVSKKKKQEFLGHEDDFRSPTNSKLKGVVSVREMMKEAEEAETANLVAKQLKQQQQEQEQQQQQQIQNSSSNNNNNDNLPFSAHAAAFMVESYARTIHEQMLEHREDLLRSLRSSLRERVAFEKATQEIREAETFAAKAGAIRSMESSKVMKENADLRFQLEEALAACERQKEITAAVAKELADVKASYETSLIAYSSIGSPALGLTTN